MTKDYTAKIEHHRKLLVWAKRSNSKVKIKAQQDAIEYFTSLQESN